DTHRQVQQQHDADVLEPSGGTGTMRLPSRSKDVATLIRDLSARPDVAYVEPNYIVSPSGTPNHPYLSLPWGIRNTGQTILGVAGTPGADISATSAWNLTTGSTANVVGIVDTGVDYTHPDLAANMWSAPSGFTITIAGTTVTCAAGTHGFNAIKNNC